MTKSARSCWRVIAVPQYTLLADCQDKNRSAIPKREYPTDFLNVL
jgi:hypothetical protein